MSGLKQKRGMKSGVSLALGLTLAGLAATPSHAEWLKAETAHFIIYGDTNRGEIERYARKVERFDSLLRAYYPIQVDHEIPKLEILLANGAADMNRIWPGVGSSVAGFYSPNSGRIFAVANTRSEMDDIVIFHEYAHHFMFQMKASGYPAWFVEGFAEYYGMSDVRAGKLEIGRFNPGRMNSLTQASNSWAPTEDVLRWRISATGRYRSFDYYAQAWAITHYMLSDPERTRKLGQYLTQVSTGGDPVETLQSVFGITATQLQDQIRRYLSGAIPILSPQIELPEAEVTTTALSPAHARLIWYDFRLDRNQTLPSEAAADATPEVRRRAERSRRDAEEYRRTLIRDALTESARFGDDPVALRVKARALHVDGRTAEAVDALQPVLTSTTADADSLRLGGQYLQLVAKDQADEAARAGMLRQARTYLAAAYEANPMDFRNYLALDDLRRGASGYPTANDLQTLEIAAALAPQSFDARTRTAQAYMARNQPALAVVMLQPVANSPHGGSGRQTSRALLAEARAAAGMAASADDAPAPGDDGEGAAAED